MITAFIGVIGSGKGHQQKLLVESGYIPLDFKDALIDMAEDLVGFKIRPIYEEFKVAVVGYVLPTMTKHQRLWGMEYSRQTLEKFPEALTGRKLFQRLGTEVMRTRDPDYWVNAFKLKARELLKEGHSIAVSDCRFDNEMEAIKALPGPCKFIFCDYHSGRYDASSKHESEKLAQKLLSEGYKDLQEIPCLL